MYEINLISDRNLKDAGQKKALRIVRILAGFCIVFLLISSIGTFFLSRSIGKSGLQQEEQTLLANLATQHEKLIKITFVNNRMATINTILKSRASYDLPIDAVLTAASSDIIFTTFSVDKKQVSFNFTSSSLLSLDQFLTNLTALVSNKTIFRSVTLNNLAANSDSGTYTAQVSMMLL